MSAGWSWFVIVSTILSMLACFWLIVWTNKQDQSVSDEDISTGHEWDGLTELNNPLPMWWLGLFILTLLFGFAYFAWYPGLGTFQGLGEWSQSEQYEAEIAQAEAQYGPLFANYGSMEVAELVKDPDALAIGRSLYANYCSQCHGAVGHGAAGFPNLADDDWLYGGDPAQIEVSILNGRAGLMPGLAGALGSEQNLEAMIAYVQGMSVEVDTSTQAHTQFITFCSACHGAEGRGMPLLGAPNLTDDVWLYGSSTRAIRETIVNGRNGVMPAHAELIGTDRARILAAYVYSLSRSSGE